MTKKRINMNLLAATLIGTLAATSVSLSSCKKSHTQEDTPAQKVESTELIRTDKSWDGVELPDYLQGRPELVAVKYVFPAGQKLGWHHHPVMNYVGPVARQRGRRRGRGLHPGHGGCEPRELRGHARPDRPAVRFAISLPREPTRLLRGRATTVEGEIPDGQVTDK